MPVVAAATAVVSSPLTTAALLLTALPQLRSLGLASPTATEVLGALDVGRSRAYELKARLEDRLGELVGPPGRPAAPEPAAASPTLATQVLRYVAEHPGAIRSGAVRNTYSDGLRLFVLDLLQRHAGLDLEACAETIAIPLGTLKDWLRDDSAAAQPEPEAAVDVERLARLDPIGPQLQTLLAEWARWDGSFTAFCDHAQRHCRLPFGRTLIASLLERCGVRERDRREGRSPDEDALRDAFVTFFPHAQWVGDGSQVPVEVDGELFVFNVELDVDAFSGAFVGANVSPTEDSAAVTDTFNDAIASTGVRPLALLLDNKPSNHTDQVQAELDDTLLIRATPFRAQNKAHVEGGYGLLKPTLAGLALDTSGSPKALAASPHPFPEATSVLRARAVAPGSPPRAPSGCRLL